MPYAYTITLIGYNSEKLRGLELPLDSWAAIFEPHYLEKVKGMSPCLTVSASFWRRR